MLPLPSVCLHRSSARATACLPTRGRPLSQETREVRAGGPLVARSNGQTATASAVEHVLMLAACSWQKSGCGGVAPSADPPLGPPLSSATGTYGEFVATDEDTLCPIPPGVSFLASRLPGPAACTHAFLSTLLPCTFYIAPVHVGNPNGLPLLACRRLLPCPWQGSRPGRRLSRLCRCRCGPQLTLHWAGQHSITPKRGFNCSNRNQTRAPYLNTRALLHSPPCAAVCAAGQACAGAWWRRRRRWLCHSGGCCCFSTHKPACSHRAPARSLAY